jgi:hypothetical protein
MMIVEYSDLLQSLIRKINDNLVRHLGTHAHARTRVFFLVCSVNIISCGCYFYWWCSARTTGRAAVVVYVVLKSDVVERPGK